MQYRSNCIKYCPLHIYCTTVLRLRGLQQGQYNVYVVYLCNSHSTPVCTLCYRYVSTREAEIQTNIL